MTEDNSSTCDLCGKEADPRYDECVFVVCKGRCHAPRDHDVYHEKCIKQYLRSFVKIIKGDRRSGFTCPKGKGKGTQVTYKCTKRVLHSQKAVVKAEVTSPKTVAPQVPTAAAVTEGPRKTSAAAPQPARVPKKPALCMPRYTGPNNAAGPSQSQQQLLNTQATAAAGPVADPLGRNLAAAAVVNAKAAKKNAKRAAAKIRRQQQDAGLATAATANHAAAADNNNNNNDDDDATIEDDDVQHSYEQQAQMWLGAGAESDSDFDDADWPWTQGEADYSAWNTPTAAAAAVMDTSGEDPYNGDPQHGDGSLEGFASDAAKRFQAAAAAAAARNAEILKVLGSLDITEEHDITDSMVDNANNSTAPAEAVRTPAQNTYQAQPASVPNAVTAVASDARDAWFISSAAADYAVASNTSATEALHPHDVMPHMGQPGATTASSHHMTDARISHRWPRAGLAEAHQQTPSVQHPQHLAPSTARGLTAAPPTPGLLTAAAAAAATSMPGVWVYSGDQLQRAHDHQAAAVAADGLHHNTVRAAGHEQSPPVPQVAAILTPQLNRSNAPPYVPAATLAAHAAAPIISNYIPQLQRQSSGSATPVFPQVMVSPPATAAAVAPPPAMPPAVHMTGPAAFAPEAATAGRIYPPQPITSAARPALVHPAFAASSAAAATSIAATAGRFPAPQPPPPPPPPPAAAAYVGRPNLLTKELLAAARIPANFSLSAPMQPPMGVAAAAQYPLPMTPRAPVANSVHSTGATPVPAGVTAFPGASNSKPAAAKPPVAPHWSQPAQAVPGSLTVAHPASRLQGMTREQSTAAAHQQKASATNLMQLVESYSPQATGARYTGPGNISTMMNAERKVTEDNRAAKDARVAAAAAGAAAAAAPSDKSAKPDVWIPSWKKRLMQQQQQQQQQSKNAGDVRTASKGQDASSSSYHSVQAATASVDEELAVEDAESDSASDDELLALLCT